MRVYDITSKKFEQEIKQNSDLGIKIMFTDSYIVFVIEMFSVYENKKNFIVKGFILQVKGKNQDIQGSQIKSKQV